MRASHAFVLLTAAITAAAPAQDDRLERLRRDQAEVLRKAERLKDLMGRLIVRFEREGRSEQVKLLKVGIAHLESSGMMDDAAAARRNLDSGAWASALRTQEQVLAELERLLAILLEHNSLEALQDEIDATSDLAATARELETRQSELQGLTAEASQTPPSAAEQAIQEQLQDLAREQRQAAEDSRQMAGQRLPVLEGALERLQSLLRAQSALEESAAREASGAPDPVQSEIFELGALQEKLRELNAQMRRGKELDRVAAEAGSLADSVQRGDDSGARRDARERLERSLADATRQRSETDLVDQDLMSLSGELQKAGDRSDAEAIAELAQRIAEAARNAADANRTRAEQAGKDAAEAARQQAAGLRERAGGEAPSGEPRSGEPSSGEPRSGEAAATDPQAGAETSPAERTDSERAAEDAAKKLEVAADRLAKAMAAQRGGDRTEAQARVSEAQRTLDQGAQALRRSNPRAADRANEMASRSNQLAGDLRNARAAEEAEREAADALARAEQALREAADRLENPEATAEQRQQARNAMEQSRANLEAAQQQLQEALEQASVNTQQSAQAAAERQQQLQQAAQQTQSAMQQAAQNGDITPEQQQAAQQAMQQAQSSMQQAQQALEQNRPSQAAQAQQQAADQLDEARQNLEQGRATGEQQQQALQAMAEQQEQLRDEILRLRQMMEERQNREAQNALDRAADAAQKAQESMEQGDRQEALEQQQEAREALEEAAEALEEERDRYMDLRQEELMFRMKDELEEFLAKQEPITAGTAEIGESAASSGRVSRPSRKRLNQYGETERELAAKLAFVREALQEEGNQVFDFVLRSNQEDLESIADRLAGRAPDPGSYTVMMQKDVEERTRELLGALEEARQRREEERQQGEQQQQEQQQQEGENKFNQQRERLVELVAELKMLRKLEEKTAEQIRQMEVLLQGRSDDISEVDARLIERLANRHNEINSVFKNIKSQLEQALQPPQEGESNQENGR